MNKPEQEALDGACGIPDRHCRCSPVIAVQAAISFGVRSPLREDDAETQGRTIALFDRTVRNWKATKWGSLKPVNLIRMAIGIFVSCLQLT